MKEGWILLYKKFQDWEWYDSPNVKVIFIHCLLEANFKNESWQGREIKRGQFPTSVEKLAFTNGLTLQQTRSALKKLQITNEIKIQTTNRYSIITVLNYDLYQTNNKQITGGLQQTNNKQSGGANNNTIKNKKNNNSNTSYINISLSHKEEITKEEREILKNYVIKNKLAKSSVAGYVNTLIRNGDYQTILEEEKKRGKKKNEVKNKIKEDFLKVKNKKQACYFIGLYGDFEDKKHPKEVKEIMEKYKIESYTEATEFLHKKGD